MKNDVPRGKASSYQHNASSRACRGIPCYDMQHRGTKPKKSTNIVTTFFPVFVTILGLLGYFVVFLTPTFALGEVGTTSPTPTGISESKVATGSAESSDSAKIKPLRDRLASVVAEMRKKDQKVVAGDLKSISGTTLEVETVFGSTEKAQIDETLTKFYRIIGAATEEIKKTDIKEKQYVIITGPHLDGVINANEVYIDEHFESRAGRVTEVDSTNFNFKLETFEKETLNISVEKSTTQEILNIKTLNVEAGSFSRIKEGDIAHIVFGVKSVKEQKTSISPSRVFIIPVGYFTK